MEIVHMEWEYIIFQMEIYMKESIINILFKEKAPITKKMVEGMKVNGKKE